MAGIGGRLHQATGRAVRLRRGGLTMRTVFWTTLLLVVVGLSYFIAIGLAQR
jgi:hypothetical protein